MNPAVITTKQAHKYVGGKPVWDELKRAFPEQLKPFRKTPRGDQYWRVEIIQHVLALAQASEVLIAE
jgi:hypothetical protein